MSSYFDDFTSDSAFMELLRTHRVREYGVSIVSLDFETEKVLASVSGKVKGGTMSLSKTTPTRRTGSLSLIFDTDTYDITDINNLLSIDKKIAITITMENPFYSVAEYRGYGASLSFKQGTFLITSASSSITSTGASVAITFIDKMGMLNGTCGGVIPSAAVLNEILVFDGDGNSVTEYPLISEIIRELVHHFGGEDYSKIIVDDVPTTGRFVVTWAGSTPVRFTENKDAFVITNTPTEEQIINFPDQYVLGDDVGYLATDLTYPGELTVNTGTNVADALTTICTTLGNYEFFYDVDGYFHFQQNKNFSMTGTVPTVVDNLSSSSPFNITSEADTDAAFQSQYLMTYSEDEYLNEFADSQLATSITYNPNYSNIKNDFVVWGTKNSGDDGCAVRYHLAIDTRPTYQKETSLCTKTIWAMRNKVTREVSRYIAVPQNVSLSGTETYPSLGDIGNSGHKNLNYRGAYNSEAEYYYTPTSVIGGGGGTSDSVLYDGDYYCVTTKSVSTAVKGEDPVDNPEFWTLIDADEEEALLHSPSLDWLSEDGFDWREELYRMALVAYGTSSEGSYYDAELLAEWRGIFNPCLERLDPGKTVASESGTGFENPYWTDFEDKWQEHFGQPDGAGENPVPWLGYTVDVVASPQQVKYWLDLIDTSTSLGGYSVSRIGRRSVSSESSSIGEVLVRDVPDILFIDGTQDEAVYLEQIDEAISTGQDYLLLQESTFSYISTRPSTGSCYEEVRSLLYTHLINNATVSLTSIPLLHLDLAKIVRLNFPEIGVYGNFIINSISYDMSSLATMSMSLAHATVVI